RLGAAEPRVLAHEERHHDLLEGGLVEAVHDQGEPALGDEGGDHAEAHQGQLDRAAHARCRSGRWRVPVLPATGGGHGHRSVTSPTTPSQSSRRSSGPSAPRTRTRESRAPRTPPKRRPSRVTGTSPSAISGTPGRGSSAKETERSSIERSSSGDSGSPKRWPALACTRVAVRCARCSPRITGVSGPTGRGASAKETERSSIERSSSGNSGSPKRWPALACTRVAVRCARCSPRITGVSGPTGRAERSPTSSVFPSGPQW